ncbi:MAG: polysaccharide pyruvyl transferase family protein [Bacteroidales bacterium]|nr:polysaccharide pyruvyl transferase family protein [Bacteroidales bacterium]
MKIAVISLPLHTNYGGILQSYALRKELERMGHEVSVIDRRVKMPFPKWWKAPFVYINRALKHVGRNPAEAPEVFRERRCKKEYPVLCSKLNEFIDRNISPVITDSYKDIRKGEYDAFVVGSDQVWRPRYFGRIEDAFLAFAKGWDVKRVAYAASFGTDVLEFGSEQLGICAELLREFDGVSVREAGAVTMLDEWFDCDRAVHVLDPVMLMTAEELLEIASGARSRRASGKVMTYFLDPAPNKTTITGMVSRWTGKEVVDYSVFPHDRNIPLEKRVVPPIEDWIAGFADADFVVTDSFHGCVLSVLLHKRFIAVGNSQRGMSRMSSLMNAFGLDSRLVHGIDPEDDGETFLAAPEWKGIDAVIEEKRDASRAFLVKSLKS